MVSLLISARPSLQLGAHPESKKYVHYNQYCSLGVPFLRRLIFVRRRNHAIYRESMLKTTALKHLAASHLSSRVGLFHPSVR